MSDNLAVTAGTGTNVASDEVTYSGDTAKLGIVRLVHVTGAEGAKTVSELVRLEDAAHTSGDPGIPALGVRQDTAASLAGTDGDYTMPIFDASGRQHVNVGASALPTGAATSAKQDTGNTSLASIDGKITAVDTGAVVVSSSALPTGASTAAKQADVYTEDAAAAADPTGNMLMAVRRDTLSVTEVSADGDNIALKATNKGQLHVKLADTVTIDGSGVTQPVSGTFWQATQPVSLASVPSHAVTNAGTFAVQATEADGANTTLGAKADAKSTATDTTAVSIMSVLKQISASVQAPPSQAVTNAGTFATQVDGSALTALQLIDDPVFADDAAYTLSTSKGNVAAGVAVQTDGTDPTAVSAEGDAAALRTDMNRILLVNTTPPRLVSATENNATAQTNNPIHSAPGAGLSLYITDIVVSNGATAGSIKFVEDTAGTPVVKVQETYMAINGGAVMAFKTPIRITANKDFGYTSTTVTTHSITVNGFIAP